MRVDYKAIADADPGGDLTTAFLAMAAETETKSRGVHKVTQLEIANQTGMAVATRFRDGLDSAVTDGLVPGWVVGALDADGIDINHPSTQGAMDGLVTAQKLQQDDVDAIIAMGSETVNVWPGLKEGYLQNAREKRAAGKI